MDKSENPDEPETSEKEKPIEIDEEDESSDDDNSVIILDSDTEPDNDEAEENREDEEQDDDDEESEDSDSDEDEDSDSSVDSDSVNSVWSDVEESARVITAEAAEADIIRKFEKAITFIADNRTDKGRKILRSLLEDPTISGYRQEDPDYETLEEPPRYAKMLKVYIAIHKNLAKLCEKELDEEKSGERVLGDKEKFKLQNVEVQHLLQVLSYDPNNAEIWLDVAMKCVESGDLNFAKYAFKRCESLKESLEAHATLLYVTCDFSGCLTVLKNLQENEGLNDKAKYLKHKIRTTSQYYKRLCDRVFEEDEVYAEIDVVDPRKILAFDERMEEFKKKLERRKKNMEEFGVEEKEEEKMEKIQIKVYAELDLPTVCTLFCDLFDRIQAYSHPREQLIHITEWESRQDFLDVAATVEKVVDVVSCVEDLTLKTEEEMLKKKKKGKKQQDKKEYLANWRRRLFVERTNSEEVTESEANTTADEDDSQDDEGESNKMPENELAQEFHLEYSDVVSIRCEENAAKKEVSRPAESYDFMDSDSVLTLLESAFSGESKTILELIEFTLQILTTIPGRLPEDMREVTREMYNRLAFFEDVHDLKYLSISVLVFEVDCRKATQALVLRYISPFWVERDQNELGDGAYTAEEKRSFVLRFMWKYVHTGLKDETKLEYLHTLHSLLNPSESVLTSSGSFSTWHIDSAIADLEKKKRIESVKHLWASKNYETLAEILQNDIDFSAIGIDEAIDLLSYWIQSLEKMKAYGALVELAARAMHFYLFSVEDEEKVEKNLELLLQKLHKISGSKFSAVPDESTLSTIGYFICHAMKKFRKFEKDWRNWRVLYEIVKIQRGDMREYIEQLNKNDDPDVMPLLELDLLVKAHEVLGEHQCCAQKNYDFLLFTIDRYRELVEENIPILEICYLKDNGYLWNNLNEELAQILFCLYGKYSRKVRARENHENGGKCGTSLDIATRVLSVILVQPLPLHDDKEKLMHDVVELINTKFPYLLEVSDEKAKAIKDFEKALQQADTVEEVVQNLAKCRDDVHSYLRSMVWYSMGLHSYRTNGFKDASKYTVLYLLTEESICDNRLRMSAWAILALTNVHDLFQLELYEIHEQWKWRIMPSRLAIQAQEHEPIPHFELAARLYQLASCLARFHRSLPKTDTRRQDIKDVETLRQESRKHFDISIELTKINDNGSQPEHQWLCYYFIGKLESKSSKWDILKVVESFYEAACGCELTGFYYPQKVQTKKQQNFEPLEVHYQAFSSVYKYLMSIETPDLEILRKLKVMLSVLSDGHKVAKQSSSLFKVNPDVYEVVDELVMSTVLKEHDVEDGKEIPTELASELRDDLCSQLKEMCIRAFTLLTEKFPHLKSHYRLAQLYSEKGDFDSASEQIFKNAFKRKKRDDGMFDNCVEIACTDLNRNGSYSFHIERCCKLGAQIAQKTNDLHNVVAMLQTMIGIVVKNDEQYLDKPSWKSVIVMYLSAMDQIVHSRDHSGSTRSTPSPCPDLPSRTTKPHHLSVKSLRTELWRLSQSLNKCSKPQEELIVLIREKAQTLISQSFGSIDELRRRMQPAPSGDGGDKRKNLVLKRKLDATDLAKSLATSSQASASSPSNPFMQLARSLLLNAQTSPSKQSPNELALQLVRLATAQAGISPSKSTVTSSTSTSAPRAPVQAPVQAPAQASAQTQPSTSTSAAVPPDPKPSSSTPNQPAATTRYSPISSDDEIQCIEPPAKKPAPGSEPSTSVTKLPSSSQPPLLKPAAPTSSLTQSTSSKPPVLKPAVPASTLSQISRSSLPGPSSSSVPGPSSSVPGPSTGPSTSAKKPTAPQINLQALMASSKKNTEELSKFMMTNMFSTDPTKQQEALLIMQTLMASQPLKTTSAPNPKTSAAAQAFQQAQLRAVQQAQQQAIQQAQEKAAQEQIKAQQVRLANERAAKLVAEETARKEKEKQRDYFQQIAYKAAAEAALKAKQAEELKEKMAREKLAREKLAKEKAAKEKQARDRQAAMQKQREKELLEQMSKMQPAQYMSLMLNAAAASQMNLPSTSGAQVQPPKVVRPVPTSSHSLPSTSGGQAQALKVVRPVPTQSTSQGYRPPQQHQIHRPQPTRVVPNPAPRSQPSTSTNSAQPNRLSAGGQPPQLPGSMLHEALANFDEATQRAIFQQYLDSIRFPDGSKKQ